MTDNQPANPAPLEATGDNPPFSAGTALREARMQHGMTIDDISTRIKFAPRQIEALEADDFERLPEAAFVRGFVRSYARLLQLDPEPLLAALPHAPVAAIMPAPQEAKVPEDVPYPDIYTERKYNIIWLAAALAVAVALALVAYLVGVKQPNEPAKESSTQGPTVETLALPEAVPVSAVSQAASVVEPASAALPAEPMQPASAVGAATEVLKAAEKAALPVAVSPAQPVAQPPATPPVASPAPVAAAGQATLHMAFDGDSWVEISDKNGKLLSKFNHAGTELDVNGRPPFALVVGNSKAVHLYYKGQAVDLAAHTKVAVARLTLE